MSFVDPQPVRPTTPRIFGKYPADVVFVLVLVLAFGTILVWNYVAATFDSGLRADLIARGVRVSGHITEVDGKYGQNVAFHFRTREGRLVSATYGASNRPETWMRRLTEGQAVDVVYDPLNSVHAIPEPDAKVPQVSPLDDTLSLAGPLFVGFGILVAGTLIRRHNAPLEPVSEL